MKLLSKEMDSGFQICGQSFYSNHDSGKWCIFLSPEDVDEVWAKVTAACLDGRLVAAMGSTKGQREHLRLDTHVICVFNENWDNIAEVNQVRDTLLELGITQEMKYKRDLNTFRGHDIFEYETVNAR